MFGADVVEMKISKVSPRSKVMKAAFLAAQCVGDGHERIFLRLQHPPAPVSFQVSFFGFLCFFLFSGFVFRFCFCCHIRWSLPVHSLSSRRTSTSHVNNKQQMTKKTTRSVLAAAAATPGYR